MLSDDLNIIVTQAEYAQVVGISEARASQLAALGVLAKGATALEWIRADHARLREAAAGRSLNLSDERAALARAQRERIELQNAATRGEQAPIEFLGDALAKAIEVMVSELDQVDALLAQTAPDLPEATRLAVLNCISSARNKVASRIGTLSLGDIDPADDIDLEDES